MGGGETHTHGFNCSAIGVVMKSDRLHNMNGFAIGQCGVQRELQR